MVFSSAPCFRPGRFSALKYSPVPRYHLRHLPDLYLETKSSLRKCGMKNTKHNVGGHEWRRGSKFNAHEQVMVLESTIPKCTSPACVESGPETPDVEEIGCCASRAGVAWQVGIRLPHVPEDRTPRQPRAIDFLGVAWRCWRLLA